MAASLSLDLSDNGLTGAVPPSLIENLKNLIHLYLNDNDLNSISFAELDDLLEGSDAPLEEIASWGNDDLPEDEDSVEVNKRVEQAALRALYEGTDGPEWVEDDSWLEETDEFLFEDWHGIRTDDDGRVVEIDLSDNGLSGEPGGELESLGALYSLDLSGNPDLSGELSRGP